MLLGSAKPMPTVPRLGQGATFADLPILDRASFRMSIEQAGGPLPLPQHELTIKKSTSGSSGVPVEFYWSGLAARMYSSHLLFDHVRQGQDLGRVKATIMI